MNSATTEVCSWCGKPLGAAQTAPGAPDSAHSPALAAEAAPDTFDVKTASADIAAPLALNDAAGLAVSAVTRKIAPGTPAPTRLRAPAPGVPPPSIRAASVPPTVPSGTTVVPSAAPLADADLNVAFDAPANSPAVNTPSLAGANLNTLPPAVSGNLAAPSLVSTDAAPLIGTAPFSMPGVPSSAMPPPAPADASLAAPFDLSPGATSAAPPSVPDRASRLLNQRPTVDMTGDVAIGTVPARQGAREETNALEPQLTKTDAERKALVDAALADDGPTPMALLTRYLGVFALILLATGLLAFVAKRFYIVPMLIAMFVSALLLPILRVTPWADEGSDDLIWFVLLTLLFGPVVALIIYGVMAAARQDFNPSILGCLAVAALARVTAELASGGVAIGHLIQATSPFGSLGHIDARLVEMLLLNWAGFAALAGWYAASSFHKEDE